MNTTSRGYRHLVICASLTATAVAIVVAWYLLSDFDASAKAAQLGAMIAMIAATGASTAHRCRRRVPERREDVGAAGAVSSGQ